jgi:hypothetical protein
VHKNTTNRFCIFAEPALPTLFQQLLYLQASIQSQIREGISANTMTKYWDKKDQVAANVFTSISWQETGKAMNKTKPDKKWC